MKKLTMLATLGLMSVAAITVRAQTARDGGITPNSPPRFRFSFGRIEQQQPFDRTPQHAEMIVVEPEKPRTNWHEGDPTRFKLSIKNTTDHALYLSHEIQRALAYSINVLYIEPVEGGRTRAKLASLTEYGKRELAPRAWTNGWDRTVLKPGEEESDTVVLNHFFDMTLPGKYIVVASRRAVPEETTDWTKVIDMVSQPVEIEVL